MPYPLDLPLKQPGSQASNVFALFVCIDVMHLYHAIIIIVIIIIMIIIIMVIIMIIIIMIINFKEKYVHNLQKYLE